MTSLFTRYDRVLCRRTMALAAMIAVLVALIVAATDERDSTWSGRMSRIAALLPLTGGLAAYLACDQARARGELRAHACLGVSSAQASRGAFVGASTMGVLGAAVLVAPWVDLRPLFPRAVAFSDRWAPRADGWFESSQGLFVDVRGELHQWVAAASEAPDGAAPRAATVAAVLVAALAFPLWGAATGTAMRRTMVAVGVAGASIAAFHLVAAARTGGAVLLLPPTLLLLDAVWLWRRAT